MNDEQAARAATETQLSQALGRLQLLESATPAGAAAAVLSTTPRVVDTKILGKPEKFDGKDEHWRMWSFVFKAYCGVVSKKLKDLMDEAVGSATPVPNTLIRDDADKGLSTQLYYMLALCTSDVALARVENAAEGDGLELWRGFCSYYEPKVASRYAGMLNKLLQFDFGSDREILDRIEVWEKDIKRYEAQSSDQIPDSIRRAILQNGLGDDELKRHVIMNAGSTPLIVSSRKRS